MFAAIMLMRLLAPPAPRLPQRPELADEIVPSERCGCASRVRPLPVAVETRGVPLCAELVDSLG